MVITLGLLCLLSFAIAETHGAVVSCGHCRILAERRWLVLNFFFITNLPLTVCQLYNEWMSVFVRPPSQGSHSDRLMLTLQDLQILDNNLNPILTVIYDSFITQGFADLPLSTSREIINIPCEKPNKRKDHHWDKFEKKICIPVKYHSAPFLIKALPFKGIRFSFQSTDIHCDTPSKQITRG